MSSRYRIREPAVAGFFYSYNENELIKQIEELFLSEHGPGITPDPVKNGKYNLISLISPHAGYMYSGPIAAHGFLYLANDGLPDTIIIVGPNHTGLGSGVSIYPGGIWKTPLGKIEIDDELVDEIIKNSNIIDIDETAHLREHSIEVQLPFLQYIYKKANKQFKLIAIILLMQDINTAMDIGSAMYHAVRKINKKVVVIASTDFTHYEPHEIARRKDKYVIDEILSLNPEGIIKVVYSRNISMCGFGPVAATVYYSKLMGATKAYLLKYGTSGDVTGDLSSVVAYASFAITKW